MWWFEIRLIPNSAVIMNQSWGDIDLDLQVQQVRPKVTKLLDTYRVTDSSLFSIVIFGPNKKYEKNHNSKTIKATSMKLISLFKLWNMLSYGVIFNAIVIFKIFRTAYNISCIFPWNSISVGFELFEFFDKIVTK